MAPHPKSVIHLSRVSLRPHLSDTKLRDLWHLDSMKGKAWKELHSWASFLPWRYFTPDISWPLLMSRERFHSVTRWIPAVSGRVWLHVRIEWEVWNSSWNDSAVGRDFGRTGLYQAKKMEEGRKKKKPVKQISLCSPFGYAASTGVQPSAAACKNLLHFSDGRRENEVG